jgi:hypothetical protein
MTKRALIAVMAVLIAGLALTPVAQAAHPYLYYGPIDGSGNTEPETTWSSLYQVADNFDEYLGGMMTPTTGTTSGCNLWIGQCGQPALWQSTAGQQGPTWIGTNNGTTGIIKGAGWAYTGSGSIDDRKISMLDEVLSPASCLDGLILNTINTIRSVQASNLTYTLNNELTLYNIRIQASVSVGTIDQTQTITTGGSTSPIPVTYFLGTLTTIPPQAIPNLWKTDKSLLRAANRYVRDAAVNMSAAYMTIGDARLTNYWQSLMGKMGATAVTVMLPSLLAGIKSDTDTLYAADLGEAVRIALGVAMSKVQVIPGDPADKTATLCNPWGTIPDLAQSVTVNVDTIGAVTVNITTGGQNICNTLADFAGKFSVGFGKYQSAVTYLATDGVGNLNGDGQTNSASYAAAAEDTNAYLQNESARPNFVPGTVADPPTGLVYGQTQDLTAAPTYNGGTAGIGYQWKDSPDGVTYTSILFANGPTYSAPINFYSFGTDLNQRYYKCEVNVNCGGTPYNQETNAVTISGTTPPPITFADPTGAGNYIPGGSATLGYTTSVGAGGPLTYQWQKFDGADWVDLAGRVQSTLTIVPIAVASAGDYRLVAFNTVAKSDAEKANPMYWEVSNPITIAVAPEITITAQPEGADLAIAGNHTMTVAASVTSGVLGFQWQRNLGFGWQDIVGENTDTYTLTGVTVNEAGRYRVKLTNVEPTYGTYSVFSNAATVNVASGAVYLVDPTADGATEDGLTWPTAFKTLQPAIDAAANDVAGNGGEVWVAGGSAGAPIVYGEERTEAWGSLSVTGSLVMKSNVAMFGGFEGYRAGAGEQETTRRDRNRFANPAVIDGSVARAGLPAYHVIVFGTSTGPSTNAAIDGFSITGGNAAGEAGDYHTWRGGAIYNWQSTPKIANCFFYGNSAAVSGGAVSNETNGASGAGAQFINCVFNGNTAFRLADSDGNAIRGGGAVFNNSANAVFTWCTLSGNVADPAGYALFGPGSGAVYNWDSSAVLSSSVFWGNTGGDLEDDVTYGSPKASAVAYTNALISSMVQQADGSWLYSAPAVAAGTGNISADPLFTNGLPPVNDFTLLAGSPSIDTGDPVLAGDDIRGVGRPINGGVAAVADMGAYELSPNGPAPVCLTQTINVAPGTVSITDPLDVFDATNSVVEGGIASIEIVPNSFDCANIPLVANGVTINVTDLLGRVGSCSADVNVFEDTPPTAVAVPITVTLDATGAYTLVQTDIEALGLGSTDNCTIDWAASTASPDTFSCAETTTPVSVTITVRDQNSNSATASALVTVIDDTKPVGAGGNVIDVDLSSVGEYTLTFSDKVALGAGSTDACGINYTATSVSPASFSCADLAGPVSVTLTPVDNNGNVGDPVVSTVNVHDVTKGTMNGIVFQNFVKDLGAYTELQALAGVTANDLCYGDITASITVTATDEALNPVAFPIPDTAAVYPAVFTLTYTATDGEGNALPLTTTLTLVDNFPPVITIIGETALTLECQDVYSDLGATCLDTESGDLTAFIGVSGLPVPTGTPGIYNVTYSVLDPISGVVAQAVRVVTVEDNSVPVITLNGNSTMGWQINTVFIDPLYTATDACAGDLSGAVTVTGAVDSNIAGSYTLTYNVTDGYNAAVPVVRTVIVGDLVNWTTQPVGGDLYSDAPVSAPLIITAVFENGVLPTTYQWFGKVGASIFPIGAPAAIPVGNTLVGAVPANALPAGTYEVFAVVNDATGANASALATVRFGTHMAVTTDLAPLSVLEADNATWPIAVANGIGDLSYQWFYNSAKAMAPLADGGGITGTNTNTLSFAPFTAALAGSYQVEVSDANETITVGPAALTVGSAVPVGGALGLAALAAMTALGGAVSIRRRK